MVPPSIQPKWFCLHLAYILPAACLLLLALSLPAQAEDNLTTLFGATASKAPPEDRDRIKEWQHWQELRGKMSEQDTLESTFSAMPVPRLDQWRAVLKRYPAAAPIEKLRLISGFFNNWKSSPDETTYGQTEHWATAQEFLKNGEGDCEDFVIVKYEALRLLGWDPKTLWLVLVADNTRADNHAVLAAKVKDTVFILDNLSSPGNLVLKESKYAPLYTPLAAMNSNDIWLFSKNGTNTVSFTSATQARQ